MNPPGNSTSGETPPTSQNQTQLQRPGQPPLTANDGSNFINEPSLPLHDAGGRSASPSWSHSQQTREPRRPLPIPNQEPHIINQPFLPPHRVDDGRTPPPSWPHLLGIEEPLQPSFIGNQESHFISEPFLPPRHHAAGGIRTLPSSTSQSQLRIQEHGQPPSRVNNGSLTIREPSPSLYSARQRTESPYFFRNEHRYERPPYQHFLGVNRESHTIKKPSSFQNYQWPPLIGNNEFHTIKNPSWSQNQLLQPQRRSLPPQPLQPSLPPRPTQHAAGSSQKRRCRVPAVCGQGRQPIFYAGNPEEFKEIVQRLTTSTDIDLSQAILNKNNLNGSSSEFTSSSMVSSSGISSSTSPPCSAMVALYDLSQVPNTVPPRDNASSFVPENRVLENSRGLRSSSIASSFPPWEVYLRQLLSRNSTLGSSSGLQSSNIMGMSSPATPSFAPVAEHRLSQVPITDLPVDNVRAFLSENSFLESSSGLQSPNIVWPTEMSSSAAQSFEQEASSNFSQVSNRVQLMDNVNSSVQEDRLLGSSSGLQSSSSPGISSPEVLSPSEIEAMLEELTKSLSGTPPRENLGGNSHGA